LLSTCLAAWFFLYLIHSPFLTFLCFAFHYTCSAFMAVCVARPHCSRV
jgi:hypothetical protein